MYGFSTVDGFMDVNECSVEMIKYVANEPSVGLYYVQQHTQNAVPNLLHLKVQDDFSWNMASDEALDKVVDKSRETTLHAENLEDSITVVRSMKEYGPSIADEMIKDIKKSLIILSTSQPQRGLIHNQSSGFQMSKSSSWGPATFGHSASSRQDGESSGSYLSTVLKSAKQRAVSIRWPQFDAKQLSDIKSEQIQSPYPPMARVATTTVSTSQDIEAEELPLSSHIVDEQPDEAIPFEGSSPTHDLSSELENYEEFKACREAKLQNWLEERENSNGHRKTSNSKA